MIMTLKKSKAPFGSSTPLAPKMNGVPLPEVRPEDDVILLMSSARVNQSLPTVKSTKSVPKVLRSCLKKRDSSPSSTYSSSSSLRSPPPRYSSKEDVAAMSEAETSPTRLRASRVRDIRTGSGTAGSDCESITKKPQSVMKKPPMAPVLHEPITLHWQLLPYNCHISRKFLRFDISHPPKNTIRDLNTGRFLPESDYSKLASRPALDEMMIRCENGPKMEPWNIYVYRKGGVRCIDVFQAIYQSFSSILDENEKKKIPRSKMSGCEKAFRRRCDMSPSLALWEQRQGMRRVDLLEGRTIFLGLAMSPARDCWLLQLGYPAA